MSCSYKLRVDKATYWFFRILRTILSKVLKSVADSVYHKHTVDDQVICYSYVLYLLQNLG